MKGSEEDQDNYEMDKATQARELLWQTAINV